MELRGLRHARRAGFQQFGGFFDAGVVCLIPLACEPGDLFSLLKNSNGPFISLHL